MGLVFLVVVPLLLGVAIAVVPLQVGGPHGLPACGRAVVLGLALRRRGDGRVVPGQRRSGWRRGQGRRRLPRLADPRRRGPRPSARPAWPATVITRRAPGLGLLETPPFAFASLVSAGALLLTLPVVAGTLVLLFVDHHYGRIVFGGQRGHRRRDQLDRPAAADLRVRHPDPRAHGRAVPGRRRPASAHAVGGARRARAVRGRRGGRRDAGHADARPQRRHAHPGPRPAGALRHHGAVARPAVPDGPRARWPGAEGRAAPAERPASASPSPPPSWAWSGRSSAC